MSEYRQYFYDCIISDIFYINKTPKEIITQIINIPVQRFLRDITCEYIPDVDEQITIIENRKSVGWILDKICIEFYWYWDIDNNDVLTFYGITNDIDTMVEDYINILED